MAIQRGGSHQRRGGWSSPSNIRTPLGAPERQRNHKEHMLSMALTLSFHASFTAMSLSNLGQRGRIDSALPVLIVATAHFAMLLGLIGPGGSGINFPGHGFGYWQPSRLGSCRQHPIGVTLMLMIGVLHFVGSGVISLGEMEAYACPVDLHAHGMLNGSWPSALGTTALDAAGCRLRIASDLFPPEDKFVLPWTIVDRLYFFAVLVTTVGYGSNLYPTTPYSRVFTITFGLCGLVIFALIATTVNNIVASFLFRLRMLVETQSVLKALRDKVSKLFRPETEIAYASPRTVQEILQINDENDMVTQFYFKFILFVLFNIASTGVFYSIEDGWTWADSLYHCLMTATTIGLGDIAPTTQTGRGFAIFHMMCSVFLFGAIITDFVAGLQETARKERVNAVLSCELSPAIVASLDKDGNGVDELE